MNDDIDGDGNRAWCCDDSMKICFMAYTMHDDGGVVSGDGSCRHESK